MANKEIYHGDRVRDKVTGFKGIVVGITRWFTGCTTIGIKPEGLSKEGKPLDAEWFDDFNVEILKSQAIPPKKIATGGPTEKPKRNMRGC